MAKTEKHESEPTIVIVNDQPTTKQQLTSAAIQIGAALAVPVALAGSVMVAGAVKSARDKIKARRAQNQLETTEPTSTEE